MANSIPYSERKFDKKHAAEYNNQFKKDHYDRVILQLPKGYKDRLKECASQEGVSVTEFVKKLIDEKIG